MLKRKSAKTDPVERHSWGVVTCYVYWYRRQRWSCNCQPPPWSCEPCAWQVAIALTCRWSRDVTHCRSQGAAISRNTAPALANKLSWCLASARWPDLRSTSRIERSMIGSTRAQMSFSKILKETRSRDIRRWIFGPQNGIFALETTRALLQILGILSWRMQEKKKSHNQDLRTDPAWSINSGKI